MLVKQEMIKMKDSMQNELKKLSLCTALLVIIGMLSGQAVFADEASVVFGVS